MRCLLDQQFHSALASATSAFTPSRLLPPPAWPPLLAVTVCYNICDRNQHQFALRILSDARSVSARLARLAAKRKRLC